MGQFEILAYLKKVKKESFGRFVDYDELSKETKTPRNKVSSSVNKLMKFYRMEKDVEYGSYGVRTGKVRLV